MTDPKKRTKKADAEPTPMSDDELSLAIARLPEGTKETFAFLSIPHGRTRAAFRHVWLHDHLGVSCRESKAVVDADVATGETTEPEKG